MSFYSRVTNILLDQNYPEYALALNGFGGVYVIGNQMKRICPGYTDSKNIYMRDDLTDDETSLLVRHEILHVLLKHFKRRNDRKGREWNIATDLEISNYYTAKDDVIVADESSVMGGGLSVMKDPQYADKIAEEIYEQIIKEAEELQKQEEQEQGENGNQGSQGGQGGDQGTNNQDGSQGSQDGQGSDGNQDGQEGENGQQGSQDGSQGSQSDQEGENGQDGDGQGNGEYDNAHPCDLSEADQDELVEAIKQAISEGAEKLPEELKKAVANSDLAEIAGLNQGRGIGKGQAPEEIQEKPEPADVKLAKKLRHYFIQQENVEKGKSYKRPNKKYAGSGIIMKARTNVYKPTKTLAVYVDISGSMSEEMVAKALGVLETIKGIKRTKIIQKYFNTAIHTEFKAGGGTEYEVCFKDAEENGYDAVMIITDDSHDSFKKAYKLDAFWLVGIEEKRGSSFSIEDLVKVGKFNPAKAGVYVNKFSVDIVGQ